MSLRKVLVVPLLASLVIFGYYSSDVLGSLNNLLDRLHLTPSLVLVLLLATLLQVIGHILRAYKTRFVLMDVKESSARFQFRALTIGYLFNTLLPFRLGELIRSRIIAAGMSISFSLALALIVFERAIDALLLGSAGLILFFIAQPASHSSLFYFPFTLVLVGLSLTFFLMILAKPQSAVRNILYKSSKILNERLQNSFRFKAWSVIYGLQRTIVKPKTLSIYLLLSVASWLSYGISAYLIVQHFFGGAAGVKQLAATIAPYFGVAIPAGPANLGTFSANTDSILNTFAGISGNPYVFTLLVWAVLVVPTALIGLTLLAFKTKESVWSRPPVTESALSMHNKLDRSGDISAEMAVFLENYFAGNTLSTIVHQLEVKGNFKLLKYFRGGSDAITILVAQDSGVVVKKIIPCEFEDRLRAQYNWLADYKNVPGIVQVLDDTKTDDYYTIDMSFDNEDVPLFDYIHSHPLKKSQAIISDAWSILDSNVHVQADKQRLHAKQREAYVEKHIYGCLEKAGAVDAELLRAAEPATIIVNGREYDNLNAIMKKIEDHPQAWADIGTYAETKKVHGDVIVDNLLVGKRSDQVLIIDPAPDGNVITGKVFDFGKNMQSFYCGYEFLLRDESAVYLREDNRIDYVDATSAQYAKLCDYVRAELAPRYLSDAEQKAMLFHAAALFIRRLKHQVYYTPANTLKFYAVGIKTLNDFLAQYDQPADR